MATPAGPPVSFGAVPTRDAVPRLPRQVITQTITYTDRTTTALITLGPGDPSSAPSILPADGDGGSSPQSAEVLSSSDVGIIVGSILGAVILGLMIWACCVARRRKLEAEERYARHYYNNGGGGDDGDEVVAYETLQRPLATYYPRFPMSIPPPAVPTYQAVPPRRSYTSNPSGRGALFYESYGRR
ncbi:hypothetical protein SAMD00023353_2000930 [Rosellinia necatrix]|uniref:Uncharacterized protein n=1 Tax=Rosellinia necatrix TaxID=77044 RepID=A0A1W2TF17_ROSNE|nr:hypothetical protein SAMD00023353_2000930 [Rosellinia necatrix]